MNMEFIFRFVRKFKGHMVALDVLEYLLNHDGEYRGSYHDFAEILRGSKGQASNIRNAVVWLMKHGFVHAELISKTRGVYITVGEHWEENV